MRSPRRIRSRCSAVYADVLRFVDEFRPLSLLIPLCTFISRLGPDGDVIHAPVDDVRMLFDSLFRSVTRVMLLQVGVGGDAGSA